MKNELIAHIDKELRTLSIYKGTNKTVKALNMKIATQINSFMARTLTSYTMVGMTLLLLLFYIQSFLLPHPGLVIEIAVAFVLLPVIAVAIQMISSVNEYNWKHQKFIFGYIPTFSKKKEKFLKNDKNIKKDIEKLNKLTGNIDHKKLKEQQERWSENLRKNGPKQSAVSRPDHTAASPKHTSEKIHIPSAYRNKNALTKFKEYLNNGRADNLKEAINLYEHEKAFIKKEKAIDRQRKEIEALHREIDNINHNNAVRTQALMRQRAQYEYQVRKKIDDLK